MTTLAQLAANLAYAAGEGAVKLADTTSAQARVHAEVGAAVAVPGPGLTQLVGRGRAVRAEAHADLAPVVDRAVNELIDGGVGLALGARR